MRRIAAILLLLPLLFSCSGRHARRAPEPAVQKDTIYPLGFLTDTLLLRSGEVRSGETFSGLLTRLGMDSADAYRLFQACDSTFDVRKMRAGNRYEAYYNPADSATLHYLVYSNDRVNQTVFRCFDSLAVWKAARPVDYLRKTADVTINSSLWNDMTAAGASPELILKLSDIYAWTVDFFGLQKGDRFRLEYGETDCDGAVISIDTVYFSVFARDTSKLYCIMVDQGDGGNLYWNEKGESMRKAFLKAPLHFSRISSGFSYARKHPVTGQVRPHTAVDYAAPTGTPVVSIGDGTVIGKAYEGGGGNTVRIRHNSVYTTAYLHLSRYAAGLKVGQRVKQGEVIGYVGMTGTATGPHLDFRVWINGSPVNPLTLESPSEEPIKEAFLPVLDSTFRAYRTLCY
ncbi:MAG: peptidoglycan DD-metalloendopeptidase family protein [Bacteroidales bacterium]|nr:peptidoglycan DD-metalloendopeptidase family protein [Bacteroidales bacterium]